MRWSQSLENLKAQKKTLCGDALLTAAVVSCFGPFTKQYCQELMEHFRIPFLKSQKVKFTVQNGSLQSRVWFVKVAVFQEFEVQICI